MILKVTEVTEHDDNPLTEKNVTFCDYLPFPLQIPESFLRVGVAASQPVHGHLWEVQHKSATGAFVCQPALLRPPFLERTPH